MKTSNFFDSKRFLSLLRMELQPHFKAGLIMLGVICAVMILKMTFEAELGEMDHKMPWIVFLAVLFIAGAIMASKVFKNMQQSESRLNYLSLPASPFEKTLTAFTITSVIFPLFLIAIFVVAYQLGNLATYLYSGLQYEAFSEKGITASYTNIFWNILYGTILVFLANQALYSLGSASFDRNSFLKTALAWFLALLGLGLFAALVFRVLFYEYFDGWNFKPNDPEINGGKTLASFGGGDRSISINEDEMASRRELAYTFEINRFSIASTFFVLLFWTATYFKIKEKEA